MESISPLETCPNELLFNVALHLDLHSIDSLSYTSTRFYQLAGDESLWRYKFYHEFPEFMKAAIEDQSTHPESTWKAIYRYAMESPLLQSPEFREIYRTLGTKLPQIRFITTHLNPDDQTALPAIISVSPHKVGDQMTVISYIEMIFPPITLSDLERLNLTHQGILNLTNCSVAYLHLRSNGLTMSICGNLIPLFETSSKMKWVPVKIGHLIDVT